MLGTFRLSSCITEESVVSRKRFIPAARDVSVKALAECERLIANGQEEAFVVLDTAVAQGQVERWRRNLPRVSPWYAIKCHPDARLMEALFAKGCGFDAASIAEIQAALAVGCSPNSIIFANPCKMPSHIRFAESVGVRMMTFDNVDELRKIKQYHSSALLVMRILGDDSSSLCKFNAKFGIAVDECAPLIREARRLGSEIVGVSFHVGSGCRSADAFVGAVENARRAFDMLQRAGFAPRVLDLGGGWPGSLAGEEEPEEIGFEEICEKVRPVLDRLFPHSEELLIIAEPGRYFAHACAIAVTNVTSKRVIYSEVPNLTGAMSSDDDTDHETDHEDGESRGIVGFRYYVNDGVYGTFNAVICDHRDRMEPAAILSMEGKTIFSVGPVFESSVWGNTCDGIDKISASVMLPDVSVGTWFVFTNMGAYTTSAASAGFNGFAVAKKYYI
jgi:ornithine decarboxylase